MKVLIAGVGYTYMRDLSVGPVVVSWLQRLEWPPEVEIQDLSYGPIAVVQWLQERPHAFQRALFVAAVARGRPLGRLYRYRWEGHLPPPEEIQQRIGEAVTGVISLDNLLIIAQHFQALPPEVFVVEVEPVDTQWGPGFTAPVQDAAEAAMAWIREMVLHGRWPIPHPDLPRTFQA